MAKLHVEEDVNRLIFMQLRLSHLNDTRQNSQALNEDAKEELHGMRRDRDEKLGEFRTVPFTITNVNGIGSVNYGTMTFVVTENNVKPDRDRSVFGDHLSGVLSIN